MFNVNDIVQHRRTGKIGKVIAYGCQLSESTYSLTLKVGGLKNVPIQPITEDTIDKWSSWQKDSQRFLLPKSPGNQVAA